MIKLIVGLNNPQPQYQQTRHNVGKWFIEKFVELNKNVLTLTPSTGMNDSGKEIAEIVKLHDLQPHEVLIVYDDIDTPLGNVRLKFKGSDGRHNGVKSVIKELNSEDFYRLRIGIDKPNCSILDYVLGEPTAEEKDLIYYAIKNGIEVVQVLLNKDFNQANQLLAKLQAK